MVQQNQQLSIQVSTSTLLIGMIAALLAIPATIFMTIWLLQPESVSAGNFDQNANTGVTYNVPAGYTLVPATVHEDGGTCTGAPASETSSKGGGGTSPVSMVPAFYSSPANVTTGSVTQTQTETNTNTNVDNSITETRYIYKNSFNEDSHDVEIEIEESFDTETEIEVDTEIELFSNNNVDNDNTVIDSEEVINTETDVDALVVGLTPYLVE